MIPLEQQCVSLPFAKRLKELGVEQSSLWYWIEVEGKGTVRIGYCTAENYVPPNTAVAAFTVAELGMMLPINITTNGKGIVTDNGDDGVPISSFLSKWELVKTEADGRAQLIIALLESKSLSTNEK